MNEKAAVRLSGKVRRLKPRNPLATAALMKKGGAHQRRDNKAGRARIKADSRRQPDDQG